jgi:hypothetical protein
MIGRILVKTPEDFRIHRARLYHFLIAVWRTKTAESARVKYWEIIADRLSAAGWSWGCVSAIDTHGRTIWIVDAHREGTRFVVRADEKLTAFVELQRAIHRMNLSFCVIQLTFRRLFSL